MLSVDGQVYGLDLNQEEDQLYISDYRKIVVTDLDGSRSKTLIVCTDRPRGLTVDLNRR